MRYIRLKHYLKTLLESVNKIDSLYFEEVRKHLGTDAAHCYGAIIATLQMWAEENKIPYAGVPVQTIKKSATGRGNANKSLMILTARKIWPNEMIKDDNEADAMFIAKYAVENLI